MKPFVKLFLVIAVIMTLASAAFANTVEIKKNNPDVTLSPTRHKDLLVLKARKNLMGAAIAVHDSKGVLVAERELQRKKMIIDFNEIPCGSYTISVIKNQDKKEFKYTKKQDSEILN